MLHKVVSYAISGRFLSVGKFIELGMSMKFVVNSQSAEVHRFNPGVPQCSIHFLPYINDLDKNVIHCVLLFVVYHWVGTFCTRNEPFIWGLSRENFFNVSWYLRVLEKAPNPGNFFYINVHHVQGPKPTPGRGLRSKKGGTKTSTKNISDRGSILLRSD